MGKFSDLAYQLKKNGPSIPSSSTEMTGAGAGMECTCPKCGYKAPEEEFMDSSNEPPTAEVTEKKGGFPPVKTGGMPGGMGGMGGM